MADPAQHTGARVESVAPLEFLRILWARKATLAFFMLAFGALGLLFASLQRPRFQASASLMLSSVGVSGIMGDLSALTALAGDTPAQAEVAVLRSRAVISTTTSMPDGDLPPTPQSPGYAQRLGLATTVTDEGLHPIRLFREALAGESPHDRPPVFADGRLFAAVSASEAGSPRRVRIEFLGPDRVRITTRGLFQRLGLADEAPAELAFVPGTPLEYRGLRLHLATRGEVSDTTFLVDHVPTYEAEQRLLESYWAGETTRGSGIVRVTVSDTDPHRAAETANAICANYLVEVERRRGRRSSPTLDYIRELLDQSRGELEQAQMQLFALHSETPELIALDEAAASLIQRISQLELLRTEAELRRRTLAEILGRLESGEIQALAGLDTAITRGVVVDPITEGYLQSIAEVNSEYSLLSQDLGDQHPELAQLRGSAEELYGLIQGQLDSRTRSLAAQVEEHANEIDGLRGELGKLPGHLLAASEPMLTAEINQRVLPALLTSLHTAEIAHESTATKVEMLDRAEPATEVHSPKLFIVALLGALFGLALGSALAFVRAPASSRILNPEDLELATSAPLLASVSLGRPAGLPLDGGEASGLRSLRASLRPLAAENEGRLVLGITGPLDVQRRAHLVLGLAQAMGQAGRKTLVVDLDLESNELHSRLDCKDRPGLLELLGQGQDEKEDWQAGVQRTAVAELHYLGAGAPAGGSLDLLAGPAFEEFLREASREYPCVLLDLPPMGTGSALEAVAASTGGVIIAAHAGQARRQSVERLAQRVRRAGAQVRGCVLLGRSAGKHV